MLSESREMGSGLLFALREELDRWMGAVRGGNGTWAPATDMYADEGELFVEVELPGVDPNDVEILTEGQEVVVRALSTDARAPRQAELLERRRGTYERTLRLSEEWDPSNARASFEFGVLTLRVPHAPEPEGVRRINLQTGREAPRPVQPEPMHLETERPYLNGGPRMTGPSFVVPAVVGGSIDNE